jgi:hypothetical protein
MKSWIIRIKKYGIKHFFSVSDGLFHHLLLDATWDFAEKIKRTLIEI